MKNKKLLLALAISVFIVCAGGIAFASDFPSKPITIVVPYSAGGGTDVQARALASVAKNYFSQPVVVVNKSGGGGAIGTAFVAQSKADGHTLLFAVPAVTVIKPYMVKTTYTFEDITPLMQITASPRILMARKGTGWKTLDELVAYAKEHPGEVSYASAGTGTTTHIALEGFALKSGIKLNHVPYKGCAKAVGAILGGHADLFGAIPSECYQYFEAGEAWPVAVFTEERLPELADVPTLKEKGIAFVEGPSRGLFIPSSVSAESVGILQEGFMKALKDPELKNLMDNIQENIVYMNGSDYSAILKNDKEFYSQVLENAGLKKY